jgi:hypothetical protein
MFSTARMRSAPLDTATKPSGHCSEENACGRAIWGPGPRRLGGGVSVKAAYDELGVAGWWRSCAPAAS